MTIHLEMPDNFFHRMRLWYNLSLDLWATTFSSLVAEYAAGGINDELAWSRLQPSLSPISARP